MTAIRYFLRDRNAGMEQAWRKCFGERPEVNVSCGDIFGLRADAIVSPANSFGFMDGGIDLAYSRHFGWQLQERLQALLHADYDGELPVGQAVIVETGDKSIPYLVSAPTMRVPMPVTGTLNVYVAFRAVLRAVQEFNQRSPRKIESVLCPGLGTSTGMVPYEVCARQMFAAYSICCLGTAHVYKDLRQAIREHERLAGRRSQAK